MGENETSYDGIPLGGDDLTGDMVTFGDLPDFDEAEVGVLQDDTPPEAVKEDDDDGGKEGKEEGADAEGGKDEGDEPEAVRGDGSGQEKKSKAEAGKEKDAKATTVKLGDVELPLDQRIEISEDYKPTVKEALDRLKTENTIRQDYGRLGTLREKERQLSEKEAVIAHQTGVIKKTVQTLTQEDKVKAVKEFLISNGVDAYEWLDSFYEQAADQLDKRRNMSEGERELERLRAQEEDRKTKEARDAEAAKGAQSQKEFGAYVSSLAKQHGLTLDEVDASYATVKNTIAKIRSGEMRVSPEDLKYYNSLINADNVTLAREMTTIAYNGKTLARVDAILDKVNPDLKNDEDVVRDVFAELANPYRQDSSEEDLVEGVRRAYGSEAAKAKGESPKASGSKTPSAEPDDGIEILSEPEAGAASSDDEDDMSDAEPMTAAQLKAM